MENKTKSTLKEKIQVGLALTACALTMGGIFYAMQTYRKPIREEIRSIPGCIIVGTEGGEITYAKFLSSEGKLGEAIIPVTSFGLENTIRASLTKNLPISATIEVRTHVYKMNWGRGKEERESIQYVNSLEGVK